MNIMARKNQKAPWEEEEEIIWVSRTEMKNDMEDLQKLGEELVGFKPSVLFLVLMEISKEKANKK